MKSLLLSLFLALILLGCQESAVTEVSPEEAMQRIASESTSEIFLSKGNSGKVTVCHFPQGNAGNVQILTVSGSSLDAHLAHDGDGIVGVDYDENCQPLPPPGCPCWADGELDDITWNIFRENPFGTTIGLISLEATDDQPFGQRANVYLDTNSCDLNGVLMGPMTDDQTAMCEADIRNMEIVEPEE